MPSAETAKVQQQLAQERSRANTMDLRRQKQIDNQIASINRLLNNGSYDDEMEELHLRAAKSGALVREVADEIQVLVLSSDKLALDSYGHRIIETLEGLLEKIQLEAEGA